MIHKFKCEGCCEPMTMNDHTFTRIYIVQQLCSACFASSVVEHAFWGDKIPGYRIIEDDFKKQVAGMFDMHKHLLNRRPRSAKVH